MCQRFVIDRAEAAGFVRCHVNNDEQICVSGEYASPGFNEQCHRKLLFLATIPIGTRSLYLDADCLPFPGLADWCNNWLAENPEAIGHGDDVSEYCMGTLLFVQTQATIDWWRFLYRLSWMFARHDQATLYALMQVAKQFPVTLAKLPKEIFANWSGGGDLSQKTWQGEQLAIPTGLLCWHANFCVGIERKIDMLERVEKFK